jgi:urease accessory protein UreF/urease accessory protein UreH
MHSTTNMPPRLLLSVMPLRPSCRLFVRFGLAACTSKNSPWRLKLRGGVAGNGRHHSTQCRSVAFEQVKRGSGTLVATADTTNSRRGSIDSGEDASVGVHQYPITRLSTVSHQAPLRLVPSPTSSTTNNTASATTTTTSASASSCSWGHYGGGLAYGDAAHLTVTVQSHARLHLHTQGANRIYAKPQTLEHLLTRDKTASTSGSGSTSTGTPSTSTLSVTVQEHGLFVHTPDFVSLHRDCVYEQASHYTLTHASANLVAVDWISAGRTASTGASFQERWHHESCTTRTTLHLPFLHSSSTVPTLVDAQTFPSTRDWQRQVQQQETSDTWPAQQQPHPLWQFNAYCTILLYGTLVQESVQRFTALSEALAAARSTAVWQRRTRHLDGRPDHIDNDDIAISHLQSQLSGGPVVMGITPVTLSETNPRAPPGATGFTVVRVAATSNEDVYRLLHHALQPLPLATPCYQSRLSATQSAPYTSSRHTDAMVTPTENAPCGGNGGGSGLTRPMAASPALLKRHSPGGSKTRMVDGDTELPRVSLIDPTQRKGPSFSSSWAAFLLADSALPTGSFAHSLGLEVTHQLGLLVRPLDARNDQQHSWNDVDVAVFVQTAVQSALQLAVPFIIVSSRQTRELVLALQDIDSIRTEPPASSQTNPPTDQATPAKAALDSYCLSWLELDAHAHAMLVSNGPACRASLDQGTNLLRWAIHVLNQTAQPRHLNGGDHVANSASTNTLVPLRAPQILSSIQAALGTRGGHTGGHVATVFGLVSCLLDLSDDDAAELFGYCIARDAVSSAVRLNVLGPLAGQALLYHASMQSATRCAIDTARAAMARELHKSTQCIASPAAVAVGAATGCAPILDVIHPCHDILATRLFRS